MGTGLCPDLAMTTQIHTNTKLSTSEVTRLAPSPTGALHLGNARTFLVNWALARQGGWRVVLRIEDLDGPRVKAGAIESCMSTLAWLGIDWDEGPVVQSADLSKYIGAMQRLAEGGWCYPSELTRTQIELAASAPQEGAHDMRCGPEHRPGEMPREFGDQSMSWRFATPQGGVGFTDAIAGVQEHEPSRSVGDFVIWTKRGQPAYQLAVVVDDARQGVTQVVRGDDLLDSAARQMLLYRALGAGPPPRYWHVPLVYGGDGKRLAKRHGDTRVETYRGRGVAAEAVIGLIAGWSGMTEGRRERMSAGEFAAGFSVDRIPRTAITFTPQDDAWLLSQAR